MTLPCGVIDSALLGWTLWQLRLAEWLGRQLHWVALGALAAVGQDKAVRSFGLGHALQQE
jgi:hypothetical protein